MIGYIALGAAAAGGLVALDRFANMSVRPIAQVPPISVSELGLGHEDVTIPSGDHRLAGWILSPERAAGDGPVILMAHGWGASYATVIRLAEPLVRGGHEVLLFDFRGHGRNTALPYVTVRHFRDDVMAVVAYARSRFPNRKLVLVGHSLGGAASVLAAAEGAPVDALVLIAAPSDVLRITSEYLTDKGMPGRLLTTVLRPFWWRRMGGTFGPHMPDRRIGGLSQPLLIIQPELDRRVAREHAERLSAASGVPYELVPGHEHTDVLGAPLTARLVDDFVTGLARVGRG
jgi:pimeloyl-ACP methyl ester carboxylesterase